VNLSNYQAVINNKYTWQYPDRRVRIKETDPSTELKHVDIYGFQNRSNIVYSFDNKHYPLSDYISNIGGYQKR